MIQTYICSCGHKEFIVTYEDDELNYNCKECENSKFFDANIAWHDFEDFLFEYKDEELPYGCDIYSDCKKLISRYGISIPKKIDFLNKGISFSTIDLYNITLSLDGEMEQNYRYEDEEDRKDIGKEDENIIFKLLEDNLLAYINQSDYFNIPVSDTKALSLNVASFFLKNKTLHHSEFFYWGNLDNLQKSYINIESALESISNHKKERTVKKAVYENYKYQLDENRKFYSSFIDSFTSNIKDVNILVKFINLRFKDSILRDTEKFLLDRFISFFKGLLHRKTDSKAF